MHSTIKRTGFWFYEVPACVLDHASGSLPVTWAWWWAVRRGQFSSASRGLTLRCVPPQRYTASRTWRADPGHVPAPHRPEPHRGGHRRDEQEGGRAPPAVLLGWSGHDQTAAQAPGQRERQVSRVPGQAIRVPGQAICRAAPVDPGNFRSFTPGPEESPPLSSVFVRFSQSQMGGSPLATRASLSPRSCLCKGWRWVQPGFLRNLVNSDCLVEASRLK